jgi:hypothetical protein
MSTNSSTDRAAEALDTLDEFVAEQESTSLQPALQRPEHRECSLRPVVDELRRQFAHDRETVSTAERLAELRGTSRRQQRQRAGVLDRLDTAETWLRERGARHREATAGGGAVRERRHPALDAVETLRDVLDATGDGTDDLAGHTVPGGER